ncbi:MAG: immunoglobulin domain-containing protein [Verrucomicrobia bacterium]|nr:immunoglobulin domain-containing protein [Verrucomicrobiota bacterium]
MMGLEGLVSWWRAEASVEDAQGTNPGTLRNGASFLTGKVGSAFNFNGLNQYVEVPNSPNLNPAESFTIECWVFPRREKVQVIMGKWGFTGDTPNQRSYIVDIQPSGAVEFSIANAARQLDNPFHVFQSPPNLVRFNAWNHVAAVYDQPLGARRIYVNGLKAAERVDEPIRILNGTSKVAIGAWMPSGSTSADHLDGLIDELAFYDRALTGGELSSIFAAGAAGKCTNDSGQRMLIYDLGSNWSDTANPNGVWSYNEGINPLPFAASWLGGTRTFAAPQPAWARSANGTGHIPAWFKSAASVSIAADWQAGDVVVHSTDVTNGPGQGIANVTWTSPLDGTVEISGAAWLGRDVGRGNTWELYVRDNRITGGILSSTDLFTRDRPYDFAAGDAGPDSLRSIPVSMGDVIKLEVARTATAGEFSVLRFRINLTTGKGRSPPRISKISDLATTWDQNTPMAEFFVSDAETPADALRVSARTTNPELVPNSSVFIAGIGANRTIFIQPVFERTGTATISVTVTDESNDSTTTNFNVSIREPDKPPSIVLQPQNQIGLIGKTVSFQVLAAGTPPLAYQWLRDSKPISAAAAEVLKLVNITTGDVGNYSVVITNSAGSTISTTAKLSVLNPLAESVTVTTLAGSGVAGYADGAGLAAQFNSPNDASVARNGLIYVADAFNHRIRQVTPDGVVSTFSGSGISGYLDGPSSSAQFNTPLGIFVDVGGDVFVADTENNRIRKVSPSASRTVTTVAGNGQPGYTDGSKETANFNFPNDVALDSFGGIYVSEFNNHTIRKVTPNGTVSTFAGTGLAGYADGLAKNARFNRPAGLAVSQTGNLYVSEWGNERIRRIAPNGEVSTLAGAGKKGFLDGAGAAALFNEPDDLTIDAEGNLFVVEHGNHAVRRVTSDGVVTTVAGTGQAGYGDGSGREAKFFSPVGLAIEADGSLIVVDSGNQLLRRIRFARLPVNWIDLAKLVAGEEPVVFKDPEGLIQPFRFYRATSP